MSNQYWIDISVPLSSGMVHWPGDPEPSFERISEIAQGAVANVIMCRMTAHTGTHMDAPPATLLTAQPASIDFRSNWPLDPRV